MQASSLQSSSSSDGQGVQLPRLPGAGENGAATGQQPSQPQRAPDDDVAVKPVAASLPQRVFPGPYAYTQHPVALDTSGEAGAVSSSSTASVVAGVSGKPDLPDADDNPENLPPFILAAAQGKLALLNEMLSTGAFDVDMVDEKNGSSALMFAAQKGHLEVVRRLLNVGANANLRSTKYGNTALTFAVHGCHLLVTRLLLAPPVIGLDHIDAEGYSLLGIAAELGDVAIASALLEAGVDIDAPVKPGMEPLRIAFDCNEVDMMRLLLQRRPGDIDRIVADGETMLLRACSYGTLPMVALLLQQGADVNRRNHDGLTPLAVAARSGFTDVLALLLAAPDVDLNFADINGDTPLCHAARNDRSDVVMQLITAGARTDLANLRDETALWIAINHDSLGAVQALLKGPGISVDKCSQEGITALMLSVFGNQGSVTQALLLAGADPWLTDHHGENAFDIAVLGEAAGAIEVLAEHGMLLDTMAKIECRVENVAFIATATDLLLWTALPANPLSNPLGFCDPALLDLPLVFMNKLIARFEEYAAPEPSLASGKLEAWLMEQGFRRAISMTMTRCLAGLPAAWRLLAGPGQQASMHHKLLVCASAMSRLRTLADEKAVLALYQGDKISSGAMLRLTGLAVRQSAELAAMAEGLLAELGGAMLSGLVADCLGKTNLAYEVNIDELKAGLAGAGFCPPLAQAIASSWQSAIGKLCAMPLAMPAGLNVMQSQRVIHDHTSTHAPMLFAVEIQRQLASRELIGQLQALTADAADAPLHALHMLFQVQCDQLRQYCTQLLEQKGAQTG